MKQKILRNVRSHDKVFTSPTMAQQQFKDECDVNHIMRKYTQTGIVEHVSRYSPQYHDVPHMSYLEAANAVASANSMFEELPAKVRDNFKNDPARFLEWVQDPDNADKFHEMGLADPPKEMSPQSDNKPPPTPPPEGDTDE